MKESEKLADAMLKTNIASITLRETLGTLREITGWKMRSEMRLSDSMDIIGRYANQQYRDKSEAAMLAVADMIAALHHHQQILAEEHSDNIINEMEEAHAAKAEAEAREKLQGAGI